MDKTIQQVMTLLKAKKCEKDSHRKKSESVIRKRQSIKCERTDCTHMNSGRSRSRFCSNSCAQKGNTGALGKRWKVKDTSKISAGLIGNTYTLGRKCSDVEKKMRSEAMLRAYAAGRIPGMLGKTQSILFKTQMSERLKGESNPAKRPEVREKIKASKKRRRELLEYTNSPDTCEKISKARLLQIFPVKDTSIEIKLQNELSSRNIIFRKHEPILGQPDIFIEPNICIFADGCYWHSCPECNIRQTDTARDISITTALKEQGYDVFRFWEHEINRSIAKCVDKIIL